MTERLDRFARGGGNRSFSTSGKLVEFLSRSFILDFDLDESDGPLLGDSRSRFSGAGGGALRRRFDFSCFRSRREDLFVTGNGGSGGDGLVLAGVGFARSCRSGGSLLI